MFMPDLVEVFLPGSVVAGGNEVGEGPGEDDLLLAEVPQREPLVRVYAQLTAPALEIDR